MNSKLDLTFWALIMVAFSYFVFMMLFMGKVFTEEKLVKLMVGAEMPYDVFYELTERSQQVFINNGGKVIKTK